MNRRILLCAISGLAGAMFFINGCDGCGCGSKPDPASAPAVSTGSVGDTAAQPARTPTRRDVVVQLGNMIPSDATWVAVFEVERVRETLHKVARNAPKLVRSRDHHDIRKRLIDLYGIDLDKTSGPCLLAGLGDSGRFLVCAAGSDISSPAESAIWSVGPYSGPIVFRRSALISTGAVEGRLVSGDQNSVIQALTLFRASQPSLGMLFSRDRNVFADLIADDGWRDFALFFPGMDPGWCDKAICRGTAVFGGRDGLLVSSIASDPDTAQTLRAAVEKGWRDKVLTSWRKAGARPDVPPEFFSDAEAAINENSVAVRSDRVLFKASGDVYDLLSVIFIEDLEWILGI
ncbi:MAG TPA: hypothetical protein PKH54_02310 [Myxococcota bacterium]|nr:hypothetical protein [Myxococcota bacterium]HOA13557.1 hypothetical protein [Myxococcota bacterium]HOC98748.1 hypothetical protein [Myxococcota bacterium]HOH76737.1 hypothetical protein [Myxococcota bacterium]HPV03825.1 hypothetical protein [Myxococcota bacterium]